MLKNKYEEHENAYENALKILNLQTLEHRRENLCLKFAKESIENNILNDLFPEYENNHLMKTRYNEKFKVLYANTDRMKNSSIIYMQNLLNKEYKEDNRRNTLNK